MSATCGKTYTQSLDRDVTQRRERTSQPMTPSSTTTARAIIDAASDYADADYIRDVSIYSPREATR